MGMCMKASGEQVQLLLACLRVPDLCQTCAACETLLDEL